MVEISQTKNEIRKRKKKFIKECCEDGCIYSELFKLSIGQPKADEPQVIKNPLFEIFSRRICKEKQHKNFICNSCSTGITLYWRDGWDVNILLCNKCGLRFEKGRFYCKKCKYVPNKKEKSNKGCVNCLYDW